MAPRSSRSATEYDKRFIVSPAGGGLASIDRCNRSIDCLVLNLLVLRLLRRAPERVRKDADRTAGRPHILHLAARHPVVDRPAADSDHFAGLHNRERLSFVHVRVLLGKLSERRLQLCRVSLASSLSWRRHPTFHFLLFTSPFPCQ